MNDDLNWLGLPHHFTDSMCVCNGDPNGAVTALRSRIQYDNIVNSNPELKDDLDALLEQTHRDGYSDGYDDGFDEATDRAD